MARREKSEIGERLLRTLRAAGERYVSGEELAQKLGITRSAVWYHIEGFRKTGYEFESKPHVGYRLLSAPDRLLPDEIALGLETRLVGREIVTYAETGSTNELVHRMARQGAREGLAVFAEHQRRGRGRMSRTWSAPREKAILLSVLFRPKLTASQAPRITLLAAVAAAEAVRKEMGALAEIKWPNDILVSGKKLGGILTEMESEADAVKYVVVGIGLNVNQSSRDFPKDIRMPATSLLLETGRRGDRIALARRLLEELERWYGVLSREGFAPVVEAWKGHSAVLGRRVEASSPLGGICRGQAAGLDPDGALLLRLDTGRIERITAGDLKIL